jgi:hypothetical protein
MHRSLYTLGGHVSWCHLTMPSFIMQLTLHATKKWTCVSTALSTFSVLYNMSGKAGEPETRANNRDVLR